MTCKLSSEAAFYLSPAPESCISGPILLCLAQRWCQWCVNCCKRDAFVLMSQSVVSGRDWRAPFWYDDCRFSPHQSPMCNYFETHRQFEPPASWWQGNTAGHRLALHLVAFSVRPEANTLTHQSMPESCLMCYWRHLPTTKWILSIIFSIISSHNFSGPRIINFFYLPLSHTFYLPCLNLNRVIYEAAMVVVKASFLN